jgi:type II secretory ATPase GspE/PulE/Tfp pilus assembly ATPase PilB-like protein
LSAVNTGEDKIITLEDPVEYHIPGIEQSQINYSKGYTYELGLKAILRHDPDIILIGETRTAETAEISINAALT